MHKTIQHFLTRFLLAGTGLTLIMLIVFRIWPNIAESLYGNFLFPIVRMVLDFIYLPISGLQAMLWLLLGVILIYLAVVIRSQKSAARKGILVLRDGLFLLCLFFTWFYWAWGFHYSRNDLMERMQWSEEVHHEMDSSWIGQELKHSVDELNRLRGSELLMFLDELEDVEQILKREEIISINEELEAILTRFHYRSTIKRARIHFLRPSGFLLKWSTAGIYWPFTGQAHVDRGIHYIKKPVTVAHELAHAHGVTDEGDCNFIAFLTCLQSDRLIDQYSAWLSYYSYLIAEYRRWGDKDAVERIESRISDQVKADRLSIRTQHDRFRDVMPGLRDIFYDTYLKSQGVVDGMKSYDRLVVLKYLFDKNEVLPSRG